MLVLVLTAAPAVAGDRACIMRGAEEVACGYLRRYGYAVSAEVEGAHVEGRPHQGRPHLCAYPSWPRAAGYYCGHPIVVGGAELRIEVER